MRIDYRWIPFVAFLSACTVGPNFQRPALQTPAPWPETQSTSEANRSVAVPEPVDPQWWNSFGDPVLTELVTRAMDSNLDIKVAAARLLESRAQLGQTKADELPTLNGNASYTRELQSADGVIGLLGGGGSSATDTNGLGGRQGGVPTSSAAQNALPPFNLYQYGFDASWELDLWGRVRRTTESASATVEAQNEARHDAIVSTAAEVARDYLNLRGTQEKLRITRENLAFAERTVQLTEERAKHGLATDLDVANAQSQAESNAADIPQEEQQEAKLINAIGVLLGEYPQALAAKLSPPSTVPMAPPRVPVGLSSELAHRRPDIREAEAQLHAATASIGAAKADFFPKITLSGSVAIQATQFTNLGSWGARSYSAGPSLSLPIFEGGRLRATLALREAQQQEAAITYRKTVLSAFQEVDDALTGFAAEQRRRDRLEASVQASKRALDIANKRYIRGLSNYLDVLTAQKALLTAEQQWVDSTATVSTNLVALYKALGGGWDTQDGAYAALPAKQE
ncbi:efflux transporter outer membrane subunit [Caballeronia sp. LZ001]|uniref:efflux transporter outer membrane subunit n=1 Tax=Caballeronia sp. LZ001 TaxID=3038553 RepID=UPI0028606585|nr:efflux transporter outer membrane subunit [Caballeronia sp. LZ001]MDR5800109.1 efflux transporter outer membrane subunit [Caballeronia sp. LZ001]